MKTSELGINLIKSVEGCRLKAYQDSVGVWTIGYGHTKTAKENQTISSDEAENLLKTDLIRFEKYINSFGLFEQYEFDALVCFAFNVGSFGKSLTSALKSRNYDETIRMWYKYINAGGKPLLGLQRRRLAEICLFCENYNDIPKVLSMSANQLDKFMSGVKKK